MKQIQSTCICPTCGQIIKWKSIVDKKPGDILSFQFDPEFIHPEPLWDNDNSIFLRFRCPNCDKVNETTYSYI